MPKIDVLLSGMKLLGASDLHLTVGLHPRYRIHGHLEPDETHPPLTEATMQEYLYEIMQPRHVAEWEEKHDLDFAHGLEGAERFRCNYFRDNNGMGAVFRIIPDRIVPIEELGLPPAVGRLVNLQRGLVLVTGPTGSGKSTTLASVIDRINTTSRKHVITIEDPIEFVHQNKQSVVSQREVGTHTHTFADALRAAIREDPDVVLVGEMRDLETIALAVTAAEMGLLVFATLHTNGAPKTIDRIVDVFPAEQQMQIRTQLAESLKAIVSQLLMRTKDGKGRVAVTEILLSAPGLNNIIRDGSVAKIMNHIQSGRALGMQSMDVALLDLLGKGVISAEDAYMKATEKQNFEKFVNMGA
jgi:twitching motility protein PilT